MGSAEQLSLGELLPGQNHGLFNIHNVAGGREGECFCGWRSETVPYTYTAAAAVLRHMARTPQGEALQRSLGKMGRGSHDA